MLLVLCSLVKRLTQKVSVSDCFFDLVTVSFHIYKCGSFSLPNASGHEAPINAGYIRGRRKMPLSSFPPRTKVLPLIMS